MRRIFMLPLLILILLLTSCHDLSGLGGRSVDGQWRARLDGEDVWMSLREDRGEIWGFGEWGYDEVYISGERIESEVYLLFEFNRFNPVELEGSIRGREIDGWLHGSGWSGERVRFYRE